MWLCENWPWWLLTVYTYQSSVQIYLLCRSFDLCLEHLYTHFLATGQLFRLDKWHACLWYWFLVDIFTYSQSYIKHSYSVLLPIFPGLMSWPLRRLISNWQWQGFTLSQKCPVCRLTLWMMSEPWIWALVYSPNSFDLSKFSYFMGFKFLSWRMESTYNETQMKYFHKLPNFVLFIIAYADERLCKWPSLYPWALQCSVAALPIPRWIPLSYSWVYMGLVACFGQQKMAKMMPHFFSV